MLLELNHNNNNNNNNNNNISNNNNGAVKKLDDVLHYEDLELTPESLLFQTPKAIRNSLMTWGYVTTDTTSSVRYEQQ